MVRYPLTHNRKKTVGTTEENGLERDYFFKSILEYPDNIWGIHPALVCCPAAYDVLQFPFAGP
jgi:hypothetical protein